MYRGIEWSIAIRKPSQVDGCPSSDLSGFLDCQREERNNLDWQSIPQVDHANFKRAGSQSRRSLVLERHQVMAFLVTHIVNGERKLSTRILEFTSGILKTLIVFSFALHLSKEIEFGHARRSSFENPHRLGISLVAARWFLQFLVITQYIGIQSSIQAANRLG